MQALALALKILKLGAGFVPVVEGLIRLVSNESERTKRAALDAAYAAAEEEVIKRRHK